MWRSLNRPHWLRCRSATSRRSPTPALDTTGCSIPPRSGACRTSTCRARTATSLWPRRWTSHWERLVEAMGIAGMGTVGGLLPARRPRIVNWIALRAEADRMDHDIAPGDELHTPSRRSLSFRSSRSIRSASWPTPITCARAAAWSSFDIGGRAARMPGAPVGHARHALGAAPPCAEARRTQLGRFRRTNRTAS